MLAEISSVRRWGFFLSVTGKRAQMPLWQKANKDADARYGVASFSAQLIQRRESRDDYFLAAAS